MIVTKIETPFRQFLESLKVPNSPNGKGGIRDAPAMAKESLQRNTR